MLVRYYAAATEAAGSEEETIPIGAHASLQELCDAITAAHPAMAGVLPQCSLLLDGAAVTDPDHPLAQVSTLDVLPPFAGG